MCQLHFLDERNLFIKPYVTGKSRPCGFVGYFIFPAKRAKRKKVEVKV